MNANISYGAHTFFNLFGAHFNLFLDKNTQKLKDKNLYVRMNDFSWLLALKHIRNGQLATVCRKYSLIFYCFLKIVTSCAAKSRRAGEKLILNSDSAAKKT